ncbi:hypothetical protein F8M41_016992 [Gigaspora margarita]|uniref:Uncharacterized protein n=1 Tax=Gigaspora margarita TaxID=4874 RepID=A0A8H4B354_GIGMA|nr:hypothetical protein F8M41_016992 [Gigaspora margarita]
MIESQEQLKKISLFDDFSTKFNGFISALECQKNSLQEVIIDQCIYDTEVEVLKSCRNLEILRIKFCTKKLMKSLENKISTLEITNFEIDASTIVQIFEKAGTLLQRLKLESANEILNENFLLETLKFNCPNIKYLNISKIKFSTQFLELVDNLQKLQFLSFSYSVEDIPEEELKIRVMQFAEILPLTLQYLDVQGDTYIVKYMDIFLNHCNASLKNLLINNIYNEKITKAIIDYCIRNKTLKYVGVFKYSSLSYNIRKQMERHVKLVSYQSIFVDC